LGIPPAEINIAEVIHTSDADVLTPSILLNIAEVIHTTDAPALPPRISVAVTASGLAFSRVSQTFNGTVTIKNTGSSKILAPIQLLFNGLTPGVTLANATGTNAGTPNITMIAPLSIAPGSPVVVNVKFKDPSHAAIHFTPQVKGGSIQSKREIPRLCGGSPFWIRSREPFSLDSFGPIPIHNPIHKKHGFQQLRWS
jgi:hypothetical protein